MALAFSSLQVQGTPLIGRADELETIVRRLVQDGARLLTLTGPAGVGKTRLALEAMQAVADRFAEGAVFVDLTVVREPVQVLPAIARALGLIDTGAQPILDRLVAYLRDREVLLVLDNLEQVVPAGQDLATILGATTGVSMLVTSRIPLRLRWEQTLRVPPLAVPEGESPPSAEDALAVPAIALFVERARTHRAEFAPTDVQMPLLLRLARQLDGLPLALELAAAQLAVLPLPVVVRRMERPVQTLRWDARDLQDRQRSLQAAIDWSYELLTEEERRLFRHVGIFAGRVFPEALAAVADLGDEDQALEGMMALVEKSLMLPARLDDKDFEPCFGILETVRQYARERLEAARELESAADAHAGYFVTLAERTDRELRGLQQRGWLQQLEAQHGDLQAALRHLLDTGDPERALRLAGALGWFWLTHGYHAEGARWLEETLARGGAAAPATRMRALLIAGLICNDRSELDKAGSLLDEALSLARSIGDQGAEAEALAYLGGRAVLIGDRAGGERLLEEALAWWRDSGEASPSYQIGLARGYLAVSAFRSGNLVRTASILSQTLAHHEAHADAHSASATRCYLAVIVGELGDTAGGIQLARRALQDSRSFADRLLVSLGVEATLFLVATPATRESRARLLGALDVLFEAVGIFGGVMARVLVPNVALLRDQIDGDDLRGPYERGRRLDMPEITDLALTILDEASRHPTGEEAKTGRPASESPLSAREQEVLQLVAQGLTSRQIGEQLFLSHRTVDHHITATMNKLGVDTRAQAVAVATQRGLL